MTKDNSCERCGACCIYFHIVYEVTSGFFMLSSYETFKEAGVTCEHLHFDNGQASCAIHNSRKRPEQCQLFSCQSREFFSRQDIAKVLTDLEETRVKIRETQSVKSL